MTMRSKLLALQWAQQCHDERYHKDIAFLPVAARMRHFAFHMVKYLGGYIEARERDDMSAVGRVLVDAFAINLAMANTLNLVLPDPAQREVSIREDAVTAATHRRAEASFVTEFAKTLGHLAKACESLDHVEAFAFRDTMRRTVVELFGLLWSEAEARRVDLEERYPQRMRQVEASNIFDDLLREDK